MIAEDAYYSHQGNLMQIIREKIENPIERVQIEKTLRYSGAEATMETAINRLKIAVKTMEKYIEENENKLQAKRTTQMGFDLS